MADQTTTIPKGWKMTTLGEVAEIIMGQSPSGESYNQNKDGLPFYQGITEFGDKYVDIKTYTNQPTKIIEENSILFSVRAPVGKINFTKHKACIGRGNAGLKMKNGQQDFLYFLLKKYEKAFLSNTTGTVFDSISGGQLRGFEILIPEDREEQRAIAAVLSSLDDKIELLREENKTLEATAQAIFKEWFVNFNFPDSEGKPYKASGGKMIPSELGDIPEGWRVGRFVDIFKIEYGKSDKKFDKDGKYPVYGAGGIVGYSNSTDYRGYQVIVGCRGTCGNITLAYENSKITHNSLIITNNWLKSYSYLFLKIIDIKKAITGSTQPQITIGDLGNIQIYIPEDCLIKLFSENMNSVFEKIKNNNSQIQTLSTLRDTLLPKLMKGEVRVKSFKD